jgi:hypothetical protein
MYNILMVDPIRPSEGTGNVGSQSDREKWADAGDIENIQIPAEARPLISMGPHI